MKKTLFIFSILLFLTTHSYGQEDTIQMKKNAIKGIGGLYLTLTRVAGVSLSYERNIKENSTIGLTINIIYIATEGHRGVGLILYPSYKYYFPTNIKLLKNIWISPYLSNLTPLYSSQNGTTSYIYGIGLSTGKRTFFTSRKKWFFDIGFGASIVRYINYNESLCTVRRGYNYLPRPILVIGKHF